MEEEIDLLVDDTPLNGRGELLEIPEEYSEREDSKLGHYETEPHIRVLSPQQTPKLIKRIRPEYDLISCRVSENVSDYAMETVKTDSLIEDNIGPL